MTQDEIIEMAKQSNLLGVIDSFHYTNRQTWIEEATAFAKLVAAKEREACAQLCIDEVWASTINGTAVEAFNYASKECANRIRARGEA